MKKLLFVLTCVCFLLSYVANGQKTKRDNSVTVHLNDGSVIKAEIDYWRAKFDVNYIEIKQGDETQRIKKKHIAKFVTTEGEFVARSVYNKSGKRVLKKKEFVRQVVSGNVNLYVKTYKKFEDDLFNGGHFQDRMVFYCQKEGEAALTLIHYNFENFDRNESFKKNAMAYFSDHEIILEKLDSGEFTYRNIVAVVNEYNK